jgi:hypothetical protein
MTDTYNIIRFFRNDRQPKVMMTGLTLEEARMHCSSGKTHKTDKHGDVVWFDGYSRDDI